MPVLGLLLGRGLAHIPGHAAHWSAPGRCRQRVTRLVIAAIRDMVSLSLPGSGLGVAEIGGGNERGPRAASRVQFEDDQLVCCLADNGPGHVQGPLRAA